MPSYDYRCPKCKRKFIAILSIGEPRCWEGEVSQMRREQGATAHYGLYSENLEKELARLESKFQMSKFKCQGDERCPQRRC